MRVAIALALYEPETEHILRQLRSIQDQTYRNWVCFVSADSPFDALLRAPAFGRFVGDTRFHWSENAQRLGYLRNFEHVIALAAACGADAIATADQDDVWYPHKLTTLVARLSSSAPLALVHSDMDVLRDGSTTGGAWEFERRAGRRVDAVSLIVRNAVTGCSMMFDAELARRYPTIPEEFGFHDHWYAVLAALHGGVHSVPERLMAYRQHDRNLVGVRSLPDRPLFSALSRLSESTPSFVGRYLAVSGRTSALMRVGAPVSRDLRRLQRPLIAGVSLIVRGLPQLAASPVLGRSLVKAGIGALSLAIRKAAPGANANVHAHIARPK